MSKKTLIILSFVIAFSLQNAQAQSNDNECLYRTHMYELILRSVITDTNVYSFLRDHDSLNVPFAICDTLIGRLGTFNFRPEMADYIYKKEDLRLYEDVYDSISSVLGEIYRKDELTVDSCLSKLKSTYDTDSIYHVIYFSPRFGDFSAATIYFFKSDSQILDATTAEWFLPRIYFLFFWDKECSNGYVTTGIMSY